MILVQISSISSRMNRIERFISQFKEHSSIITNERHIWKQHKAISDETEYLPTAVAELIRTSQTSRPDNT